jgi:hypothetical protein
MPARLLSLPARGVGLPEQFNLFAAKFSEPERLRYAEEFVSPGQAALRPGVQLFAQLAVVGNRIARGGLIH